MLLRRGYLRAPRRRWRPKPDRHRALELLAESSDGCTTTVMYARGFTPELLVDLLRGGLATATTERFVALGRAGERTRVRITEVGRQELVEGGIMSGWQRLGVVISILWLVGLPTYVLVDSNAPVIFIVAVAAYPARSSPTGGKLGSTIWLTLKNGRRMMNAGKLPAI